MSKFDKKMTLEKLQEAVKELSKNLDRVLAEISGDVTAIQRQLKLQQESIEELKKKKT